MNSDNNSKFAHIKERCFLNMNDLLKEKIQDNIVIIKINKSFHEDMSALELYDVTRGCWKRKIESVEKAEYALSVVYGEVKEVYKIAKWVPAEEMERETIPYDSKKDKGMVEYIDTPKISEILMDEFMEPMGISAYKLAQEIHVPVSRIQDLLHDRRKITADTSLRLAKYFGVSD